MKVARKLIVIGVCLAAAASASLTERLLKVPLLDVGRLWVRATRELFETMRLTVLRVTDMSSPWSVAVACVCIITTYYLYKLLWAPLNRIRRLGDSGYIPGENMSRRDIVNRVRKARVIGDVPPVYPNGWFAVLESRDLSLRAVKDIRVLGKLTL